MAQLPTCIPDLSGHSVDDGRFFLKRCLGIGGYGRVYLAVDITSGVRYAVKCQIRAAPGSSRAGFQRAETVIHEAVSGHPNIITFHRVIELSSAEREFYGDLVFFVMDLCDGPDLFDMIMNKAFAQNDELVRHVFLKLVDAVFHCHQNGVFHRDIKPENILVSKDTEKVHLTDFGLATTSLFSSEIGVGSHNYMAPECIGSAGFRRDRVFHRFTDIWSLGVMLSTMVTGRMPWHRASMSDKHFKAYFHNRYYLEQSLPGMSKPAHRLLRQMLALEPADRIPLADLRRRVFNMQTFFSTPTKPALCPVVTVPPPLNTKAVMFSDAIPVFPADAIVYGFAQMVPEASNDITDCSITSTGPITPEPPPADPGTLVSDIKLDEDSRSTRQKCISLADAAVLSAADGISRVGKPCQAPLGHSPTDAQTCIYPGSDIADVILRYRNLDEIPTSLRSGLPDSDKWSRTHDLDRLAQAFEPSWSGHG